MIHNNIKRAIPDVHIKLFIYYKNKKLKTRLNSTLDTLRPPLSHV